MELLLLLRCFNSTISMLIVVLLLHNPARCERFALGVQRSLQDNRHIGNPGKYVVATRLSSARSLSQNIVFKNHAKFGPMAL